MSFVTADGRALPLEIEWNGVRSCLAFQAIEGFTLGQAAHLSSCSCEFHRKLRSDEESEAQNT
jgi:hypothetical protein